MAMSASRLFAPCALDYGGRRVGPSPRRWPLVNPFFSCHPTLVGRGVWGIAPGTPEEWARRKRPRAKFTGGDAFPRGAGQGVLLGVDLFLAPTPPSHQRGGLSRGLGDPGGQRGRGALQRGHPREAFGREVSTLFVSIASSRSSLVSIPRCWRVRTSKPARASRSQARTSCGLRRPWRTSSYHSADSLAECRRQSRSRRRAARRGSPAPSRRPSAPLLLPFGFDVGQSRLDAAALVVPTAAPRRARPACRPARLEVSPG